MWYVIQTRTGKENKIKESIEHNIPAPVCEKVWIFYYETKRKYNGEWHVEKKTMFPGYLFVETEMVEELFMAIKKIPEMTKVLGYGDEMVPISKQEEQFLRRLSGDDDVLEMSYGIQEGDRITVHEGSLKGLESIIRKVDRHKRKAYIEVDLLGQIRQVEIGLEIISKTK